MGLLRLRLAMTNPDRACFIASLATLAWPRNDNSSFPDLLVQSTYFPDNPDSLGLISSFKKNRISNPDFKIKQVFRFPLPDLL